MKISEKREQIIRMLDQSENDRSTKYVLANDLFHLGLSMYSANNSIDSIIYSSFNSSILDETIAFHPEQICALRAIEGHKAVVISASTSFGKTYCIFEYIARHKPKTVVLIVPTLALSREYYVILLKTKAIFFQDYHIHLNIEDDIIYDFSQMNIFILTHEKATSRTNLSLLPRIDFLVVDEVYKLDIKNDDDRTLIFNVAYFLLAKKSEKYVLLAPFISGIKNRELLEKEPFFFSSQYSPVLNDIEIVDVKIDDANIDEVNNRFDKTDKILYDNCKDENTLVYFPSPSNIEDYVRKIVNKKKDIELSRDEKEFLKWAENEFDSQWSVCIALKKGYLVNHGKMAVGVRNYLLSLFNSDNSNKHILLCTSTLIEGVNTAAKNLIIVKAAKKSMVRGALPFKSFDFYNLSGRTGRLNKFYVGRTFYIKSQNDSDYKKEDAAVEISFEITEKTDDIYMQLNSSCQNENINTKLRECGLTIDDFVNKIGTPMRFSTFEKLNENYSNHREALIKSLESKNVFESYKIVTNLVALDNDPRQYGVIKKIVDSKHRKVKDILNEIKDFQSLKNKSIDEKIAIIVNIRNNYLEHSFLQRCKVLKMLLEKKEKNFLAAQKVEIFFIRPIEEMYYLNVPYKKMLKSIGIYDNDIDTITNFIGADYKDMKELKESLLQNYKSFHLLISFISKYAINSII